MKVRQTNRGFVHFTAVPGCHPGEEAKVIESSNATRATLWLSVRDFEGALSTMELSLEGARKLRKRLRWLERHHYHKGGRR